MGFSAPGRKGTVIDAYFRVLGPLEVVADGPVALGGIRQRAMLAALLIRANQPVTYAQLIAAVWDEPPASARQQIHNVVRRLRTGLARVASNLTVATGDIGYTAHVDPRFVDHCAFETAVARAAAAARRQATGEAIAALEEALGYWRGPALAEFDSAAMTSWSQALDEQRLAACEQLAALLLADGQHERLAAGFRRIVAENPLRESLRGALMTALHRAGHHADALSVYEQGRTHAREVLGVDPGAEIQRVYLEILRDTAVDDQPVEPELVPIPDPVEPGGSSNLPYRQADFVGRAAEVEEIVGAARRVGNRGLTVLTIDGMGGVGKTALALRAAHLLAADQPDGRYFVDLRGFSDQHPPLSVGDALDLLLRAARVDVKSIPDDPAARAQLWRAVTAGRRILLILDNVVDAEQAHALMPGDGDGVVLVTSRRKLLMLPGATAVTLSGLPDEEAVDLFIQVAGASRTGDARRAQIRAVVRRCGRLPLAIRIVAARFRSQSAWSLADLVEQLRRESSGSPTSRLVRLDSTFQLSYQYLEEPHQLLFRVLALHPFDDFDAYAAAAAGGVPVAAAAEALDAALDDNLLEEHTPRRYRYHDLVRRFAHTLAVRTLPPDAADAAAEQRLRYYLAAALDWGRDLEEEAFALPADRATPRAETPPADTVEERLAAFGAERANLVAAVRLAAARSDHRTAWQLVVALEPYLRSMSYAADSLELVRLGIAAARADGDAHGLAVLLTVESLIHRERGSVPVGRAPLDEALEIAGVAAGLRVHQLTLHGATRLDAQDFAAAHTSFNAALARAVELDSDASLGGAEMNLGVLARETGDYESALDFLHRACRHLEAAGIPYGIALSNLGTVYHALGRLDDAATALSRSIELCETYGAAINLSFACAYLSATVRRRGDPAEATELARRALRIAMERDLPGARAEALNTLGEALLGLADPAEAEACFTAAIAEAERARLPRYVGRGYEGLAHASAATGDTAAARRQRNRALAIYPAEAAAAAGPRAHLLSPSATCARCAVVGHPHRRPPENAHHAPVPLPSAEQPPVPRPLHLR